MILEILILIYKKNPTWWNPIITINHESIAALEK